MATNTFTGHAAGTDFYSQLIIEGFTQQLMSINAFSTNTTNETAFRGDTVSCLNIGGGLVYDYATSSSYVMPSTTAGSIDVKLDRTKVISWTVKDNEARNSILMNNSAFFSSRGKLLASAVLTDIFATLASSASVANSSSIALSSFSASSVSNISLEMDTLLIPSGERSLVLNPTYATRLRQDSALQNAAAFGQSSVIQHGIIPSIDKFGAVYQVDVLPSGSVGFGFYKGSVLYAQRVVLPPTPNVTIFTKTLTSPEGLCLSYWSWRDELIGQTDNCVAVNYGFTVPNAGASIRLY